MKKTIVYFSMFLLTVSLALAASLSRDMPTRVSPGEEVKVTFSISGMDVGKEAGISEVVPVGITVKEQTVTGAEGTPTYEVVDTNHKWSFKASSSSCTVTYKFDAPAVGTYNFDAVYALPPANINNIKSTLTVRTITCGDGFCEGDENSDNCVADCPKAQPTTEEVKGKPNIVGWVIAGVVVVIGLIVYFVVTKKKKVEE